MPWRHCADGDSVLNANPDGDGVYDRDRDDFCHRNEHRYYHGHQHGDGRSVARSHGYFEWRHYHINDAYEHPV